MKKADNGVMPMMEHLAELRLRLALSAGVLLVATIISFSRVEVVRAFLTAPLEGLALIYLSPPEAFVANLRLAFGSGLVFSLPVIIHQVSAFVFPGLTRDERVFYLSVLGGVLFLFASGVLFAYFVVFPFTLGFFLQFAFDTLEPRFAVSEYLSFFFSFHLAFGAVFQLPLLTWALGKTGLLSSTTLRKYRRAAILGLLLLSAAITPPDIISQVILVLPLVVLYETGVIMVIISERKSRRRSSCVGG